MDKDFHKTFDLCPNCGSNLRFCEELGKELKERGLARPEWNMRFDTRSGVVADQNRAILIPIGSHLPGYGILTDICMNCGTVYAVELRRLEGEIHATPMQESPFDPNNIRAN